MKEPIPLSSRASRAIIGLLARERLLTLACSRADGWPQATTVGYVNQGLDLYFKVARDSQKFANFKVDPRASIAIRLSGPDCGDGVGVSMAGEAVEVTDPEVATRMGAAVIERFPGVDVHCPSGSSAALLHFRPRLISTVGVAKGRSDPETFIPAGAASGAEAAPAVPGDLQPARAPGPSRAAHGGAPGRGLKRRVRRDRRYAHHGLRGQIGGSVGRSGRCRACLSQCGCGPDRAWHDAGSLAVPDRRWRACSR